MYSYTVNKNKLIEKNRMHTARNIHIWSSMKFLEEGGGGFEIFLY